MNPELRYAKALYDLCFLKPKHKLLIPSIAENESIAHSKYSVTKRDNPKIGIKVITNGITKQWTAQVRLENIPILSIILIHSSFCENI